MTKKNLKKCYFNYISTKDCAVLKIITTMEIIVINIFSSYVCTYVYLYLHEHEYKSFFGNGWLRPYVFDDKQACRQFLANTNMTTV